MNLLKTNNRFCLPFFIGSLLLQPTAFAKASPTIDVKNQKLVSVGGGLTEIIYALGSSKNIVGVDTTSRWPKEAVEKSQVGYQRRLSAEGILSLKPTALMVTDDAGPEEVLQQIMSAGVPIHKFVRKFSVEGVIENITNVAKILGKEEEGQALTSKIAGDYETLKETLNKQTEKPTVAFFIGIGKGSPMASGGDTSANSMIEMAGGINVFKDLKSYKQISTESMIAAAPDVILIARHAAKGKKLDDLIKHKSISQTPAVKNNRVIIVDTLLMLGYGPRIIEAISTVSAQIHVSETLTTSVN